MTTRDTSGVKRSVLSMLDERIAFNEKKAEKLEQEALYIRSIMVKEDILLKQAIERLPDPSEVEAPKL